MRLFRRRGRDRTTPDTTAGRDPDGLSLPLDRAEDLGRVRDLGLVLEATRALPHDAILYLEGSRRSLAPELLEALHANAAPQPIRVARGTLWPRPATFHILLTASNLDRIREIESRHAAPEICDHLVVYRDDEVLLTAYDAGDGAVYVAKALGEPTIKRMRSILAGDS